jgi:hypothetical protein
VSGDEKRFALAGKVEKKVPKFAAGNGVNASGRFIQKD